MIEQIDRDAAARVYQNFRDYDYARWVSNGTNATGDADWAIQAFAAHRQAAYAAGMERAAEILDHLDGFGEWREAAAAIRAEKDKA